jgi:cell filamentation protein
MSDNPAWDAYFIPGTHVLKNTQNITDPRELEKFERTVTAIRDAEIRENPIPGDFDLQHFQAIHKKLFGDVYPFAGKLRNVDITKPGTTFTLKELLPRNAAFLANDIKSLRYLRGMDKEIFTDTMSNVAAEVNILHPFREGNGRSTRVFIEQLANDAGYELDFRKIDTDKWRLAAIASSRGNVGGIWKQPDLQDLKPLQTVIATSAVYEPTKAFDRLTPQDAIARYPQLDGAYAALAKAKQEGKDLDSERNRISTELHAGRLIDGASPEHSLVAINRAARGRGLFARDASETTGPQKGEIVATSSHHVLLKTGQGEAIRYSRDALQSPVYANDKVMIENGKVRDLSLDKPAAEYAIGRAAETGKTYDGLVIWVTDKQVHQLTSEGVICHDRASLSGMKTFALDDRINVRYPYENVGLVKKAGDKEISRQRQEKAHEYRR